MEREAYETSLAPVVAEYGLGVLPYYGLASGFLAGKYRSAAAGHGVSPATVALAWLRTRPGAVAPLASARTIDQLPALPASATLGLSPDEIAVLDEASATYPQRVLRVRVTEG